MTKIYQLFLAFIAAAFIITFLSLIGNAGVYLLTCAPKGMDFLAFFTGAYLLFHSSTQLYDLHSQIISQQHILPISKDTHVFLPFINPPFVTIIFAPFIHLGVINAYLSWLIINSLLFTIICFLGYRQISEHKLSIKIIFIICTITFIPILTALLIGQLSILLSLILLLSWIFSKKKWDFGSGLMLSLLLIKPHFFLVPFLAVLVQRRRKLTLGLLSGAAILIALSYALVGPNGIASYIQTLMRTSQNDPIYGVDLMSQHSIQTALLILFHTQSVHLIQLPWILLDLCLILPLLFVWNKQRSPNSVQFSLQWIMLILITLLTSPHTHFHDLSFLIVAAIIVLSLSNKLKKKLRNTLFSLLLLGYAIQLIGYIADVQTHGATQSAWIMGNVVYILIFLSILWKNLGINLKHINHKT
ncbi:MAG TPA: glycosyltransferase 87 family protein [Candidatus Saccharimonadales bacterium]|nr:glycosyltransferase 87 family protein [Candidatus Saccharimonadales bacterium]